MLLAVSYNLAMSSMHEIDNGEIEAASTSKKTARSGTKSQAHKEAQLGICISIMSATVST
jgi:hypothetical protein